MSLSEKTSPNDEAFDRALEAFSARRIANAINLFDMAERGGHDPDECAAYRWFGWMASGRFEDAWRESDAIAVRGRPDPYRLWDGRPFTGKRVLIRCLHGFGDAIQFIRYAGLARREASRVMVQAHPDLVSLLRGTPFADYVFTWPDDPNDPAQQWDRQVEVMELPYVFRTTLETVPREIPYLSVCPASSRIAPRQNAKQRICLQWGSGDWDPSRSVRLAEFSPILEVPGCEFYTLQRGTPRAELEAPEFRGAIRDISAESSEILQAAASLMHVDLLITVDTMLAHLAGALGKPVWVLLPYAADWRWMLERQDSPWYPTMRLFRQQAPGDWRSPVREIAAALREFSKE